MRSVLVMTHLAAGCQAGGDTSEAEQSGPSAERAPAFIPGKVQWPLGLSQCPRSLLRVSSLNSPKPVAAGGISRGERREEVKMQEASPLLRDFPQKVTGKGTGSPSPAAAPKGLL